MFKAGIDQASKMHNSVVILTSGGVALAPSILFYSSHFGDVDKWAFGAGVFILILATGMLLYEFSLLIEAYLIDDKISESTDLEEMFQNIKNDKFLLNWYRFLQVGKRDQESLHLVIDQLAFRLLFWLTLLQGTIIGISTFAFNQWNEYSNIIIWEIVLFLLIAPFLIFRILQIGKYLYLLRELSLPENLNILNMIEKQYSTNNCNPCLNCGQDVCDNLKLHNLSCHELPQDGESFCTYQKEKLDLKWYFFAGVCSVLLCLLISFFATLYGGLLEILAWGITAFVTYHLVLFTAIYILFISFLNLDMKGELNLYYTRDRIIVSNKVRIVKTSDRFFLVKDFIVYDGIRYKVSPRFRKYPEKLIAFLNYKQRLWQSYEEADNADK
jgi:hypothetical protein